MVDTSSTSSLAYLLLIQPRKSGLFLEYGLSGLPEIQVPQELTSETTVHRITIHSRSGEHEDHSLNRIDRLGSMTCTA